jgi:hypothetical protein
MLCVISCLDSVTNLHKVTEQIFLYDLFCIYAESVQMIFVAKNK